ncbi:MAG: hypothetical protein ACRCXC_01505 [Legionella sp.]
MSVALAAVLHYKNKRVIEYFCSYHPESTSADAELLFTDLLAWLWLNQHRAWLGKKTYLFGPLLILDEMWHSFILHTRDYFNFSMHYFDAYVHHDVEPIGFEHMMKEEELTDYVQDCFTHLGQEWVTRRFEVALLEPIH